MQLQCLASEDEENADGSSPKAGALRSSVYCCASACERAGGCFDLWGSKGLGVKQCQSLGALSCHLVSQNVALARSIYLHGCDAIAPSPAGPHSLGKVIQQQIGLVIFRDDLVLITSCCISKALLKASCCVGINSQTQSQLFVYEVPGQLKHFLLFIVVTQHSRLMNPFPFTLFTPYPFLSAWMDHIWWLKCSKKSVCITAGCWHPILDMHAAGGRGLALPPLRLLVLVRS